MTLNRPNAKHPIDDITAWVFAVAVLALFLALVYWTK